MAKILEFRGPSARGESETLQREKSGDVVIFPGVRYQHWVDDNGSEGAQSGGHKRPIRERQNIRE